MAPFLAAGAILFALGLYGILAGAPPVRRLLAANIMGNGTFLVLMATGRESAGPDAVAGDPVAHALVLTGIVVAVSATGLGLELVCRVREAGADPDHSG